MRDRARFLVAALLACLVLVTAVAYAPALGGPWQFDDHVGVAVDPAARDPALWWRDLARHVRPVLKASHVAVAAASSFVAEASGGALSVSPATWQRAGNLAFHLAAVLVSYAWMRALQRRFRTAAEPADPSLEPLQAGVAATVLALHPLSTEAVSYVSGRSASLATLLAMAALLAWLRVRTGPRPLTWFAAGTLLWLAAAGTREAAWPLPLAWALAEGLASASGAASPLGASPSTRRAARRAVALLAAAMAVLVALALTHPRYAPLLELSVRIAEARAASPTFATAFAHLGCVAVLACAPTVDPQPEAAGQLATVVTVIVLALLGVCAWRARRRQPMLSFAIGWGALWLLPTYALSIRHDVVAERHAYPVVWSLGVAVAVLVAALASRVCRVSARAVGERATARARHAASVALAGTGLILATVLTARTVERNREWQSEAALWSAALREAPHPTPRILNNLGVAWLEAQRWADAERVLTAAQALAPDDDSVAVNLERARRRSLH